MEQRIPPASLQLRIFAQELVTHRYGERKLVIVAQLDCCLRPLHALVDSHQMLVRARKPGVDIVQARYIFCRLCQEPGPLQEFGRLVMPRMIMMIASEGRRREGESVC